MQRPDERHSGLIYRGAGAVDRSHTDSALSHYEPDCVPTRMDVLSR